jgi:hypothetical protein
MMTAKKIIPKENCLIPIIQRPAPIFLSLSQKSTLEPIYPTVEYMLCSIVQATTQRLACSWLVRAERVPTDAGQVVYLSALCSRLFWLIQALLKALFQSRVSGHRVGRSATTEVDPSTTTPNQFFYAVLPPEKNL